MDNATLNRFFSLHYLCPFLISAIAVIHMAAVHFDGSNNPLGISSVSDKISFFPYFFIPEFLEYYVLPIFGARVPFPCCVRIHTY